MTVYINGVAVAAYTDAEAVAAVKAAVKLNQLQNPDGAVALAAQILDNIGAPSDAGDALRKGTRVTTAELPAMTDEKIWKGTGANVEEIDVPTARAIAIGTYSGDNTVNRAIPHGLGVTPDLVLIREDGAGKSACFIIIRVAMIMEIAGGGSEIVTIPDATNFYVGNAISYTRTANATGDDYRWIAIG